MNCVIHIQHSISWIKGCVKVCNVTHKICFHGIVSYSQSLHGHSLFKLISKNFSAWFVYIHVQIHFRSKELARIVVLGNINWQWLSLVLQDRTTSLTRHTQQAVHSSPHTSPHATMPKSFGVRTGSLVPHKSCSIIGIPHYAW